jgi:hypothetical protein
VEVASQFNRPSRVSYLCSVNTARPTLAVSSYTRRRIHFVLYGDVTLFTFTRWLAKHHRAWLAVRRERIHETENLQLFGLNITSVGCGGVVCCNRMYVEV